MDRASLSIRANEYERHRWRLHSLRGYSCKKRCAYRSKKTYNSDAPLSILINFSKDISYYAVCIREIYAIHHTFADLWILVVR